MFGQVSSYKSVANEFISLTSCHGFKGTKNEGFIPSSLLDLDLLPQKV